MIVILDDDKNRLLRVLVWYPEAVTFEMAHELTKFLEGNREPISLLMLDHDLGLEIFVDSDRVDCGMEVVRWLEANPQAREHIGIAICHSCNDSGREKMCEGLKDMGIDVANQPFPSITEDMMALLIGTGDARNAN